MAEGVSYRLDLGPEGDPEKPALDPVARSKAVADYLGDMIGQLEGMARLQGFDLVAYLLSMARVEAQTHARALQDKTRAGGA